MEQSLQLVPWYAVVEQSVDEAIRPFMWPAGIGWGYSDISDYPVYPGAVQQSAPG
ncbi:MAG: hypothetical protein QNJ46_33860 [Leptolyngbyaceae cyanobacterium MO_188.B28]|nr:hypothetical protein [Leptolyngbyaceae cyanobacterium MO_188.B28]